MLHDRCHILEEICSFIIFFIALVCVCRYFLFAFLPIERNSVAFSNATENRRTHELSEFLMVIYKMFAFLLNFNNDISFITGTTGHFDTSVGGTNEGSGSHQLNSDIDKHFELKFFRSFLAAYIALI